MKKLILVLLWGGALPALARAQTCGWPARQVGGSWSSAQFYAQENSPGPDRELEVVRQVKLGNIPDFMRQFEVLHLPARYRGQSVTLEVDVAPDYLAIGTDQDFVRTPLTNYAAQYLAGQMGFVLPTTYLVDRIYDQARVQMRPQPTDWYKSSPLMRLGSNYIVFNHTLELQRNGRPGLIAGHKKDVVLTNRLDQNTGKVAIYGWQQPGNHPIQPLALPHDYYYEDYSHGIRMLGPQLRVVAANGTVTAHSLVEALRDAELGPLLNGGQKLNDVRAARTCSPEFAFAVGAKVQNCPPQPRLCP